MTATIGHAVTKGFLKSEKSPMIKAKNGSRWAPIFPILRLLWAAKSEGPFKVMFGG